MISEPFNNKAEDILLGEVLNPKTVDRKELLERLDAAQKKLDALREELQRCNNL